MSTSHALAAVCAPVDLAIRGRLAPTIAGITGKLRLFMLMVLGLIIEWPDWALPHRFASGLPVVGHAVPSNLFPHHAVKPTRTSAQLLGPSADEWNTRLSGGAKASTEANRILWENTRSESRGTPGAFHQACLGCQAW